MTFVSLFAGIGGMDLGCEMAGWRCVYQCEIDPFCRAVLRKHWPRVPQHADVRTLTGDMVRAAVDGPIDAVVGGPPCQAASVAGKRKGADDERWLWGEYIRLVRELRPVFLIAENVPGFLFHSDSTAVFGDLQGAGYEVWPVVFGACDVGAPHRRKRVWIIGYSMANGERNKSQQRHDAKMQRRRSEQAKQTRLGSGSGSGLVDAESPRREGDEPERRECAGRCVGEHGQFRWPARPGEPQHEWEPNRLIRLGHAVSDGGLACEPRREADRRKVACGSGGGGALDWEFEFELGGVPNGIEPSLVQAIASHFGYSFRDACDWVKRNWKRIRSRQNKSALKAIGNAVVPQCAYIVARAISEAVQ